MSGLDNKLHPNGSNHKGNVNIVSHKVVSVALTPASVDTIVGEQEAFVIALVHDVKAGDIILGGGPQYDLTTAVMAGEMYVSADNEITIGFVNPTAGALVPAAGTWSFLIGRPG